MKSLLISLVFLLFVACNNSNSGYNNNGSSGLSKQNMERSLKKSLIDIEKESPLDYLSAKYKIDMNLISGKDVVKGTITNEATLAGFKDIQFDIKCYSKTESLIGTQSFTVYEYIGPGSSVKFNHKFRSPKKTRTIGLTMTWATPQ